MTAPHFATPAYPAKPARNPEQFSFELAVRKLMRKHQPRMTIKMLAERVDRSPLTTRDTIKRNTPSVATCKRFAEAFGIPLCEFIQEGYIR